MWADCVKPKPHTSHLNLGGKKKEREKNHVNWLMAGVWINTFSAGPVSTVGKHMSL
jgi:hypothetical protein